MKKMFLTILTLSSFIVLFGQENPQQDSLKEYAGKYVFPEGSVVTEIMVSLQEGSLYASSTAGNSELKKIDKDIFEIIAFSGKAFFKRNAQAKLSGVRIEVEDLILEGTKSEDAFVLKAEKSLPLNSK